LKAYLDPILQTILPLLTDKHSPDIRAASSPALSALFQAYVHAYTSGFVPIETLSNASNQCLHGLLVSLAGEINSTSRQCTAEAIRDILQTHFETGATDVDGIHRNPVCNIPRENATELIPHLLARSKDALSRRQDKATAILQNQALDDEDRDACAVELEEEDDLLAVLTDSIGYLLKLQSESFMEVIERLVVGSYAPFLSPSAPESLQALAVCLIDDIIEYGGVAAHKYILQCLPTFFRNLASGHQVLRQSSSYGIALVAKLTPDLLLPQIHTALPLLTALVKAPTAKDEECEGTTENALFAIGFLCTNPIFRTVSWGEEFVSSVVVQLWLDNLPLTADPMEAKTTARLLCDVVVSRDTFVLGEDGRNMQQVGSLLRKMVDAAKSAGEDAALIHPDILIRAEGILSQF